MKTKIGLALLVVLIALGAAAAGLLHNTRFLAWLYAEQAQKRLVRERADSDLFDGKALRVALCGTSSPLPDPSRAKSCAVVIAGDRAFVVDTGPESWKTLASANFPAGRIAAVFLTHFHSDHIGDLGEFRMQSWIGGRRQLLPVYGGAGVERVVVGFNEAFALDDSYRAAHHGPDVAPLGAAPLVAKAFAVGSSEGRNHAATIYEEDGLKVTAFEVDHAPVKPAVGYRFDYKGRSVVFSGDTTRWPNVVKWAKGADLLVHEAQSQGMRKILVEAAEKAGDKSLTKILEDIETYHATPQEAAEVANEAAVKLVVFTHLTPPLSSPILSPLFFDGVEQVRPGSGWAVGFDGMLIALPIGGETIVRSSLATGTFR
jgi:ribonuclease Z